jgi:arylsulfatase A-like enzyme
MPHVFNGTEANYKGNPNAVPLIRDWIDTPTLGNIFREAGYETAHAGKLHVEGSYPYRPEHEGTFGFRFLHDDIREKSAYASAEFLRTIGDRPFFLWASFDQPHDICGFLRKEPPELSDSELPPLPDNHSPAENESSWTSRFRDGTLGKEEAFELGLNRKFGLKSVNWDEQKWREYRGVYRRFMDEADRYIGIILDALEQEGPADNTVVVFTCDHGDHDGAHQLTMKRHFFEEAAHVPFIIKDPRTDRTGIADAGHLISNGLDLYPTLCDYAGIPVPDKLPGSSVKPLADGDSPEDWQDAVCSQTIGGRMIRTGDYKYSVFNFEGTSGEELYNLSEDPGETVNIAGNPDQRDVVEKMRNALAVWTESQKDSKGMRYLEEIV